MKATFITQVVKDDSSNATGIPVPAEAVAALGMKKRPPVKVSLAGYSYRTTVAAYGELFMLPLSAEHRNAAGLKAGDQVEVTLELDLEPRTVVVPADLTTALMASPGATEAFAALSYTMRKESVLQVETAKTQETRERRILKTLPVWQENNQKTMHPFTNVTDNIPDQLPSDLPAGLAAPARRALAGAGISSLEQLATFSEAEVEQLHGIGPNALEQLRRALAARGLAFSAGELPENFTGK